MSPVPKHHEEVRARARASSAIALQSIALNAVLAAVKFTGGILGHTYALIADGAESLVDIVSSLLVWVGLRIAGRPPDENHPYGHGKAEPLAGMAVAMVIFVIAGWIASHAVHQLLTPHQGPHWGTLPLLAAIIAVKIIFSRHAARKGEEAGSNTLRIEAWHQYADAITSCAAFIGISIAVIGGKGFETADAWAALVACVVISWTGISLFRQALNDTMDIAAPLDFENQVRTAAMAVPGVRGIDKCRVRKSGLSHLVDIHVEVDGELSVTKGHDIAGAVKHSLLQSPLRISDVLVHIEPASPANRI